MNLLFKLKKLFGFDVNMVVVAYVAGVPSKESKNIMFEALKKTYGTSRILLVYGEERTDIQIQYF